MDVTRQEPRLKGSFKEIQAVYKEMFFVLHQILDRIDTIKFLRQQYGSAVLEDLSVSKRKRFLRSLANNDFFSLVFTSTVERSMVV